MISLGMAILPTSCSSAANSRFVAGRRRAPAARRASRARRTTLLNAHRCSRHRPRRHRPGPAPFHDRRVQLEQLSSRLWRSWAPANTPISATSAVRRACGCLVKLSAKPARGGVRAASPRSPRSRTCSEKPACRRGEANAEAVKSTHELSPQGGSRSAALAWPGRTGPARTRRPGRWKTRRCPTRAGAGPAESRRPGLRGTGDRRSHYHCDRHVASGSAKRSGTNASWVGTVNPSGVTKRTRSQHEREQAQAAGRDREGAGRAGHPQHGHGGSEAKGDEARRSARAGARRRPAMQEGVSEELLLELGSKDIPRLDRPDPGRSLEIGTSRHPYRRPRTALWAATSRARAAEESLVRQLKIERPGASRGRKAEAQTRVR